ncbi:MAG: di-trans,poly-cis-decaprenylcistransferase [SAR86 cluster bacterium]|uniref:Ditrans,polycis-undecaprenyl-diphosphate synthase ((2E,6E)-farnesyl-diphosphate specific) n=1 Tax=SAR86 cluster bacterium TaxID=2030880 RepID=A0A2A5AZ99_9GAMM|nr:MAG: di-trans,poly-cis-decaprenylcistransferase [SAR86 cluster bacterium]
MTAVTNSEIPQHIAIIMDGNNRWATARGLPAKSGHRYGAETARDIVNSCISRNIKYLTLFAFSSENWMRPSDEVRGLMALFLSVLKRKEINQLHKKNVRLCFIGNRKSFSQKLQTNMQEVEQLTRNNTGTTVIVAADYGGRWDIANAARNIAKKVESGEITSESIDSELVQQHTSISQYPDPDLCIRTGGEHRISNFLLWQFAYTEFYFSDCYWPDFNDDNFQLALDEFASRQRRFGGHEDKSDQDE